MASEIQQFRMLIGGRAADAQSGATFESQNPYTGQPWAVLPDGGPADVDAAVAAARAALDGEWGSLTGFARSALLRRLGDLATANADRLARLEVNDSGKLYREMIGQLNGLGGWYQYFAGLADKIEGRQIPAADNINKVTLELGGKSPQVVFADADLEAAANGIVAGVFAATGQTCMAGSRLIVQAGVHDELVRLVAARASAIRLGDPNSAGTEMGPVANAPQYRKVLGYLDTAKAEGATVACGGTADAGLGGLFVKPTVLTGITPESTVYREEVFGPVLAALTFTDEDEAVKLANDTPYGLAGAVWTRDIHRAHRVAARIRAGSVWINAYRVVAPSVPFGGFKQSGLGRENGIHAIDEYLEEKAIWVELTGGTRDPFTLG